MNFTQENIDKILAGEKTMTRRIVKDGEVLFKGDKADVVIDASNRDKWATGYDYAICPGRGKKAVGRIRIMAIRPERLQDISDEDARREGIRMSELIDSDDRAKAFLVLYAGEYRRRFSELWDSIYHHQCAKQWDKNPSVWVLSFELVE